MAGEQLGSSIQSLLQSMAAGNTSELQEKIRQFNLTYANDVAQQYGYNAGPGQPAAPYAPNLAAQQAQGAVGYVPGLTGYNADQSLVAQNQYANLAAQSAGLTGFYTQPNQSQYSPGTWVQLSSDPSQTPADVIASQGRQVAYVMPNGQIQRVDLPTAQKMGFTGNAVSVPYQQFMALASAPPTGTPQQTLAGLTGYQGLNTAANANALATAAATGYYQAPTPTLPPGYANDGSNFYQQPEAQQQAYMNVHHDANLAMLAWVKDQNQAIDQSRAAQGLPPMTAYGAAGATGPQQTMAREQQTYAQQMGMIAQAASLQASPFRQQQAIGQMGNLLGGRGVAGFSAPNTVAGVGTAGGNTQGGLGYLSQMIEDIRNPEANQTSMNSVLDAIPTPTKLNSNEFLRAAPSTQSMVLQGMQEKYGLDPTDALAQIRQTLPQFTAPTTQGTVKR